MKVEMTLHCSDTSFTHGMGVIHRQQMNSPQLTSHTITIQ